MVKGMEPPCRRRSTNRSPRLAEASKPLRRLVPVVLPSRRPACLARVDTIVGVAMPLRRNCFAGTASPELLRRNRPPHQSGQSLQAALHALSLTRCCRRCLESKRPSRFAGVRRSYLEAAENAGLPVGIFNSFHLSRRQSRLGRSFYFVEAFNPLRRARRATHPVVEVFRRPRALVASADRRRVRA